MTLDQTYAPGSRVRVRGEEWAVEKSLPLSTGGHAVHVKGLTELVRGHQAIFLDSLDDIQHLRPEDTRLVSDESTGWTREMLLSVLRADARFRLSRWGAVGLSEWESVRFPSRMEILERCFAAGDGRVSVEAAMDQVEAVYGERPDRATLWGPVQQLGARIVGDWIVRGGSSP